MKTTYIKPERKTGYRIINQSIPVQILDRRGEPFYNTLETPQVQDFNLPAGSYKVLQGKIGELGSPVDYNKLPLPRPERDKKLNPENFEVIVAPNPYKATVNWKEKCIIFDPSIRDSSLPKLMFIFYHECGHRYYKSEEACDAYAYNRMIEEGYNPEQIGDFLGTLSDKNSYREEVLVNSILGDHCDHFDGEVINTFIPDEFVGKEVHITFPVTSHSRIPGDWFPLWDVEQILTVGNVGRVYDTTIDNEGFTWLLLGNMKNWIKYDTQRMKLVELDLQDQPTAHWGCTEWMFWHKKLVAAYGRTSANDIFIPKWKQYSNSLDRSFCGYNSDFFNYFEAAGLGDLVLSWLQAFITPTASAVHNAATTAEKATKTINTIIPIAVIALAIILIIKLKDK